MKLCSRTSTTRFSETYRFFGPCKHLLYASTEFLADHFTNREPHDLLHRSKVMATERAETFTLLVDPKVPGKDKISFHGEERQLKRAKDLALVIDRFAKDLPGQVNLTFTKHDQPACALGYQHKERLMELAAEGDCACIPVSRHVHLT